MAKACMTNFELSRLYEIGCSKLYGSLLPRKCLDEISISANVKFGRSASICKEFNRQEAPQSHVPSIFKTKLPSGAVEASQLPYIIQESRRIPAFLLAPALPRHNLNYL